MDDAKLPLAQIRKYFKSIAAPMLIFIVVIISFGFSQFYTIKVVRRGKTPTPKNIKLDFDPNNLEDEDLQAAYSYIKFKNIKSAFIPTGIPDVYGEELDISFDEVQDAIDKVQIFGPTYGDERKKITLTGDDLERYKNVGSQIACEYCCGVKTLTQEDGSAACGCAHSIMMRGLTAYLIKNHPEITNEQILEELNKWKITYFPKQTLSAYLQELAESGEPGADEILEEFPDFLPQMVGGC